MKPLLALLAFAALGLTACEGADKEITAASKNATEAMLSPEEEIERIGNKWAVLYAAAPNPDACAEWDELHPNRDVVAKYMAQPACEQIVCRRVGDRAIENCTPVSRGFQKSFADATVQDVAIKGDRAAARFSNGETVELDRVNEHEVRLRGAWWISKVGGTGGRRLFDDGDRLSPTARFADREAGVRFRLDGPVLTVRLLASAPRKTRDRVNGERIRATCGKGFTEGPGPGPFADPLQTRTRLWPVGRALVPFRFRGDNSRVARWCRLEDPVVGHVAFVKFR